MDSNMEEQKKKIQTQEETAQALSDLAEKLEEMDKAEGFFGEAVTDKELEDVAGGAKPVIPTFNPTCGKCGWHWYQSFPPTGCFHDPPIDGCPYAWMMSIPSNDRKKQEP